MQQIINRLKYDTQKATLIASDRYWDGNNWERHGRNSFLYRTPNGRYFLYHKTQWQGERDYIEPVSLGEAMDHWENLQEKEADWETAFPGHTLEDA